MISCNILLRVFYCGDTCLSLLTRLFTANKIDRRNRMLRDYIFTPEQYRLRFALIALNKLA